MTTAAAGAATGAAVRAEPAARRARTARSDLPLRILYWACFGLVVALVAIPLAALVLGSFRTAPPGSPGAWTLRNYAALASSGVLSAVGVTLWVGVASSALCLALGTAFALLIHRTDFAGRRVLGGLLGLAFYFPSFILAMAWIIVGAPGGVWNSVVDDVLGWPGLRIDIYSLWGIVFVMVLHQTPFVYLTLRAPVTNMDGVFEEAARTSGARPATVLLRVTLPLLAYSIASSFILTFVITIEQFAVPALLGLPGHVNVLATQLYVLIRFSPTDYGLAAAIGVVLSLATGLAVLAQRRLVRTSRLVTVTGKAGRPTRIALGGWAPLAGVLAFGFVVLALVLPVVILIYTSLQKWFTANPFEGDYTVRNYVYLWESASTIASIWNTLVVSGVGAAAGIALGFALAYATLRWHPPGSRLLGAIAALPFGVPGIVLGLGLLWAYAYLPVPLYGTLAIIVVAFVTRFLPYATETVGGQLVQVDPTLEEAAWTSGRTRLGGIVHVLLPLLRPSLQSGYALLFMVFFREISTAIFLYAATTSVIAVSIWAFFEQANWGLASAMSMAAIVLMFAIGSLIASLEPAMRRMMRAP